MFRNNNHDTIITIKYILSNDFGGEFWLAMMTLILGLIAMCIKAILASKCSDTEICFGCLRIIRDTKVEVDLELATINKNNPGSGNIV